MSKNKTLNVTPMKPRAFIMFLSQRGCVVDSGGAWAELNGRHARLPTRRDGEIPKDVVRKVFKDLGMLSAT